MNEKNVEVKVSRDDFGIVYRVETNESVPVLFSIKPWAQPK